MQDKEQDTTIREAFLDDRSLAGLDEVDLGLADVTPDDGVAEIGEAAAGDGTDISQTEDRDPHE